jgi:hypothetical protein
VGSDTSASLTSQPTCAVTPALPTDPGAGSYPVVCSGAADSNYDISYVNGTLTINPAPLTVTSSSATIVYGQKPSLTPSYSGFVYNDSASSLTTAPTCAPEPSTAIDVGHYPTLCSGAVDTNYTFTYEPGTLTITPANLTITAPKVTRYFGTPNVLTPTYSGLENGDTGTATPSTCVTPATTSSKPGNYAVICSGASDPNYNISYADGGQNGELTIVKAPTSFSISASKASNGGLIFNETGLPSGIRGYVVISRNGGGLGGCVITLNGQYNQATSCQGSNLKSTQGATFSATFTDGDGNYDNSNSSNEVNE